MVKSRPGMPHEVSEGIITGGSPGRVPLDPFHLTSAGPPSPKDARQGYCGAVGRSRVEQLKDRAPWRFHSHPDKARHELSKPELGINCAETVSGTKQNPESVTICGGFVRAGRETGREGIPGGIPYLCLPS